MFAGLASHIEERTVSGTFVFKLTELHSEYTSLLGESGVEKNKVEIANTITFLEIAKNSYMMERALHLFLIKA